MLTTWVLAAMKLDLSRITWIDQKRARSDAVTVLQNEFSFPSFAFILRPSDFWSALYFLSIDLKFT